jgi:transcriptional regulator with XRE-family HTH domain
MEESLGYKIGMRMKAKRKALQMTQEDLERLSRIPQGTISRLESGKADDPQISTLRALAVILEMSLDDLVEMPTAAGKAQD